MARTYDDIYFTNCNGELHLHLDGPSGTNESVATAEYFRVNFYNATPVYQSGYSGNGCSKWVSGIQYTYSDQFLLTNEDDLDLVLDINDTDSDFLIYYEEDDATDSVTLTTPGGHDDCFENNWWKDGLRLGSAGGGASIIVTIMYYKSNEYIGVSTDVGMNRIASRTTGAVYVYNAPTGTSGRALIDDDGTSRSGTDYGVTSTPLQSMATTSGCTGDPHVTTFGGCKYTL